MEGQISELNKRKEEYIRRIEATPRVEEEYKTMMVERNNTQVKYDDLMRKLMEARVSQGLEKEQKGERFTLIEPASLPEKPYKPNRMAIMLIGLVLGIGTGIGSASLKEYTDDSIRTSEDLKRVTSSPVLASIPLFVSAEEILRRKKRITVIISAAGATFLSCIVLFHFFVMNLDIFWLKLLRRLGI